MAQSSIADGGWGREGLQIPLFLELFLVAFPAESLSLVRMIDSYRALWNDLTVQAFGLASKALVWSLKHRGP